MDKDSIYNLFCVLILLQSIISINGQNGAIKFKEESNDGSVCLVGNCVKARECLDAALEHKKNIRKVVFCKLTNNINETFVCCPPRVIERKKNLSLADCLSNYLEFRPSTPVGVYSAVNGIAADPTEFANMVKIM